MSVTGPDEPVDPATVPLPDEADDLIAEHASQDFWEQQEDRVIRHHVNPRLRLFLPSDSLTRPWPLHQLGTRITQGVFRDNNVFQDHWRDNPPLFDRYLDRRHHFFQEQTTKVK